jgi:hypothetical protein
MITMADVVKFEAFEASLAEIDTSPLSALDTLPELFGFVIAETRAESGSEDHEADVVELLVRSIGLGPTSVRSIERVLRSLGYHAVSARLREIAGRRTRTLTPLE